MTDLAAVTDLTILTPTASAQEITRVCNQAKDWGCYGVCIHPHWVKHAVDLLTNTPIHVITVIGFPLGLSTTQSKISESQQAVSLGVNEIDVVCNPAHIKYDLPGLHKEVSAIVNGVYRVDIIVKAIIETGQLSPAEQTRAGQIVADAGASFVKTSTGFGPGGATIDIVTRLAQAVKDQAHIKASGGIKSADHARALIDAGASRLGLSRGSAIFGDNT